MERALKKYDKELAATNKLKDMISEVLSTNNILSDIFTKYKHKMNALELMNNLNIQFNKTEKELCMESTKMQNRITMLKKEMENLNKKINGYVEFNQILIESDSLENRSKQKAQKKKYKEKK